MRTFDDFVQRWSSFRQSLQETRTLLDPLREVGFRQVQIVYDRGQFAWDHANEVLSACTLDRRQIYDLIDPFHAADELFAHIFFEKVLEVLHGTDSPEAMVEAGKLAAANPHPENASANFDWECIYRYCDDLFSRNSLSELLTQAYMFRMPMLFEMHEVFLSNGGLLRLLSHLRLNHQDQSGAESTSLPTDVIAWEFFRQLVSPYVDPLNETSVSRISKMLNQRQEEIERLKNKCFELALGIGSQDDLRSLVPKVREHIRAKALNELEALLKLDSRSFSAFSSELFSDEKSWLALIAFLTGLLSGGEVITAAAAISTLALIGAKAVKQRASEKQKLDAHPMTLIYRLSR
jgi:hypothetical protein